MRIAIKRVYEPASRNDGRRILVDRLWPRGQFRRRYRAELDENDVAVESLREAIGKGPATLLYGARDEDHNHAIVIRDLLVGHNRKR